MNQRLFRLLLLVGCCNAPAAHAAESYDNCTGFIDTLPATISTQGTWCLRHDLSTAITSGNAIVIATNNVTIDCNHHKLGGLAAGTGTGAYGIFAEDRHNATVRRCAIRGFRVGIYFHGTASASGPGSGHLIEDNRLEQNTWMGISLDGDNNRVQRNRIYDTGNAPFTNTAWGMAVDNAEVIDNTVAGVYATGSANNAIGIHMDGWGIEARGNQVRDLAPAGTGVALGLVNNFGTTNFTGNWVSSILAVDGTGIAAKSGSPKSTCRDNTVVNFATGIAANCLDAGGNSVQ
ncbi:MAG TPA: right-handed parallel beta-helix repeat-containing protein [Lysobacter sp.]